MRQVTVDRRDRRDEVWLDGSGGRRDRSRGEGELLVAIDDVARRAARVDAPWGFCGRRIVAGRGEAVRRWVGAHGEIAEFPRGGVVVDVVGVALGVGIYHHRDD